MRKFQVNVNGNSYIVEVDELTGSAPAPVRTIAAAPAPAQAAPAPAPVAAAPAPAQAPAAKPAGGVALKSPLPGTVCKLLVADGATVKKGQKIISVEAMKMENEIDSPADGTVTFLVRQGQSIDTGAELAVVG